MKMQRGLVCLPWAATHQRILQKIKDEQDEHERWQPLEGHIQARSEAKFTHGICPDCMRKLYPQY